MRRCKVPAASLKLPLRSRISSLADKKLYAVFIFSWIDRPWSPLGKQYSEKADPGLSGRMVVPLPIPMMTMVTTTMTTTMTMCVVLVLLFSGQSQCHLQGNLAIVSIGRKRRSGVAGISINPYFL